MDFELNAVKRDIVIEGFNSIYYFEFGKNFSHPPERHTFWEMVYVDMGEIFAVSGTRGRRLGQGEIIFHRPMEIHAHASSGGMPNNMIVVAFTSHSEAMNFFNGKTFTLGKTEKTLLSLFLDEAKHALGRLPGDRNDKNPIDFSDSPLGSTQMLECYLTELLIQLMRGGTAERSFAICGARSIGESSIAELIANYLSENRARTVTLSELCSRFYMGKSKLFSIFRDFAGTSPMEYHEKQRLAEAKKLLAGGTHTVSAASEALGYSSIHTFSRAFKREVGVSPSEYAKTINLA